MGVKKNSKKKFIPVNEPLLIGNEKKYLSECIDTGWISSEGSFVSEFEKKFAEYAQREHGVAVCNGTAAIELLFSSLDLNKGDEIILPAFTIISCISYILRAGLKPILVDCEPGKWSMCLDQVEAKISVKTKAIFAVHIYDLPLDMDRLVQICEKHNIFLIEDAAEMHGQTYKNRPCGSFGHASIFSFYSNKLISTGEGGMVLTNDSALFRRLKSGRNLYFGDIHRYEHEYLGSNYRMTNLQAAVGLAQLEQIDYFIRRKHEIGRLYNKLLTGNAYFNLPPEKNKFSQSIYWVYGLTVKDNILVNANDVIDYLSANFIGARNFFCPLNLQPAIRKEGLFLDQRFPVSEKLYEKGFYIPCGLGITDKQITLVADALNSYKPY